MEHITRVTYYGKDILWKIYMYMYIYYMAKHTQIRNSRTLCSRLGLVSPDLAGFRRVVGARSLQFGESKMYVLQSVWHRSVTQRMAPNVLNMHYQIGHFLFEMFDRDTCRTPEAKSWTGSNHRL